MWLVMHSVMSVCVSLSLFVPQLSNALTWKLHFWSAGMSSEYLMSSSYIKVIESWSKEWSTFSWKAFLFTYTFTLTVVFAALVYIYLVPFQTELCKKIISCVCQFLQWPTLSVFFTVHCTLLCNLDTNSIVVMCCYCIACVVKIIIVNYCALHISCCNVPVFFRRTWLLTPFQQYYNLIAGHSAFVVCFR